MLKSRLSPLGQQGGPSLEVQALGETAHEIGKIVERSTLTTSSPPPPQRPQLFQHLELPLRIASASAKSTTHIPLVGESILSTIGIGGPTIYMIAVVAVLPINVLAREAKWGDRRMLDTTMFVLVVRRLHHELDIPHHRLLRLQRAINNSSDICHPMNLCEHARRLRRPAAVASKDHHLVGAAAA